MANRLAPISRETSTLRCKLAAVSRHHPENVTEIAELKQQLKFHRVREYLEAVWTEEPMLTPRQRGVLTAVLLEGPISHG